MKKLWSLLLVLVLVLSVVPVMQVQAADKIDVIEIDPGSDQYAVGDTPWLTPTVHDGRLEVGYVAWVCEKDKTYAISDVLEGIENPYAATYKPLEKFEAGKSYQFVLCAVVKKEKGTFSSNIKHIVYTDAKLTVTETDTYSIATGVLKTMTPGGDSFYDQFGKNTLTINKKKVSLKKSNKKQTYTIKASSENKGTITYKSNIKKVKVSKKGVVTIPAKFKGKVVITVKSPADGPIEGDSAKVTITVK